MLAVIKALFLQDAKINEFLRQLHRILIRVDQMVLNLFQIAKEDIQLFLAAATDFIQHNIRDVHFIASLSEQLPQFQCILHFFRCVQLIQVADH